MINNQNCGLPLSSEQPPRPGGACRFRGCVPVCIYLPHLCSPFSTSCSGGAPPPR